MVNSASVMWPVSQVGTRLVKAVLRCPVCGIGHSGHREIRYSRGRAGRYFHAVVDEERWRPRWWLFWNLGGIVAVHLVASGGWTTTTTVLASIALR